MLCFTKICLFIFTRLELNHVIMLYLNYILALCLYNRTVIALLYWCCGFYTHNCERPILCLHHDSFSAVVALEREDCSVSTENKCDFVCDCEDCSDEQDCGKILNFCVFIPSGMYLCLSFHYIIYVFVYRLNNRLSRTGVCVWFWARGEVWMDRQVNWSWVRVAETAEREHASWQWAVLRLHHWHFHRYMRVQLTLPAGAAYIYITFQNPVIDLIKLKSIKTSVKLNSVSVQLIDFKNGNEYLGMIGFIFAHYIQ